MWTKERIVQLVEDRIEENSQLEYKAAGAISRDEKKKTEISKDVSAFANSQGGIIIYGISEHEDKKHIPEKIDPIDGNEYSKEWLENIILGNISPSINGLKIYPVQIDKPENNHLVYVVEIPKSNTAHQANDKKYYKRYNFQSKPMEDWEIKDIINRQNISDIKIQFIPHKSYEVINDIVSNNRNVSLSYDIWVVNTGNIMSQYIDCFIKGKIECVNYIFDIFHKKDGFELYYSNTREIKVEIAEKEHIISHERIPVLPKTSRLIGEIRIRPAFIINNYELDIQIATEDHCKFFKINTSELLKSQSFPLVDTVI